jgi:hypothetical protein
MRQAFISSLGSILWAGCLACFSGTALAVCFADSTRTALAPSAGNPLELASRQADTGKPVGIKWHLSRATGGRDRFLIVGFPEAVRFSGDGFIAVNRGSRAPRSLQTLADNTRLIVPIGGAYANLSGSAAMEFFAAGPVVLPWSIVELQPDGRERCVEVVLQTGALNLNVSPGALELTLQDRFATGAPTASYISPDRALVLSEFEDRYQVHDQSTGDLLLDRAGAHPRFSPTGRFVTAETGFARIEIVDVRAQRVIYASDDVDAGHFGEPAVIGWSNADSILLISFSRQGTLAVALPFVNERVVLAHDVGCNGSCAGFGDTGMIFDLDRIAFTVANDLLDLPGKRMAMSLYGGRR